MWWLFFPHCFTEWSALHVQDHPRRFELEKGGVQVKSSENKELIIFQQQEAGQITAGQIKDHVKDIIRLVTIFIH